MNGIRRLTLRTLPGEMVLNGGVLIKNELRREPPGSGRARSPEELFREIGDAVLDPERFIGTMERGVFRARPAARMRNNPRWLCAKFGTEDPWDVWIEGAVRAPGPAGLELFLSARTEEKNGLKITAPDKDEDDGEVSGGCGVAWIGETPEGHIMIEVPYMLCTEARLITRDGEAGGWAFALRGGPAYPESDEPPFVITRFELPGDGNGTEESA